MAGGDIGFQRGKSNSQQRQRVEANPLVQETMEQVLNRGTELLDQVPGTPEYYQGDGVADLTPQQEAALGAQYGRGVSGSQAEAGLSDYINNYFGQDFTSGAQGGAEQLMGGLGASQQALQGLAGGGMGLGSANQFAQDGMGGAYGAGLQQQASGAINPLTAQMFQQAAGNLSEQFNENVVPGINSSFAMAGRTGSGLQADALGNAAGELADAQAGLAAQMFGGASESALQRQLAASQAGLGQDLARRNLAAGLYEGDANRQLGAAGTLQSGGLGGIGAMGNLAGLQQGAAGMTGLDSTLDYQNLGAMRDVGDVLQAQNQAETDFDMARYEHNATREIQDHNRQLGTLGAVTGLTSGLAGTGQTQGSQQGTSTQVGSKKQ